MSDATVVCPHCNSSFALTESLAAPLLALTRQHYEEKLSRKDVDIARREQALRDAEQVVSEAKRSIDQRIATEVSTKLAEQRAGVVADEARKARAQAAAEIDAKCSELVELNEVLRLKEAKLAQAQKAQADLVRKQRELDDAMREQDLTVEKRIQEGLAGVRTQAKREAEEGLKLKVIEKDQTIASMQQKIEELKQKADQGSQQMQGEVQELELENVLRTSFPIDSIVPVPKGEFGGDVVQAVRGSQGQLCGAILWESKRTRNWSDTWLTKLRDDQRAAKADLCVLVTQALPKSIETFGLLDGVWVTTPRAAVAVAIALRHTLLEVAAARSASEGQQTKTEMVYEYLTGPRFRQRIEAIVEAFVSMGEELDRERRAAERTFCKREKEIERVMKATVGMYGDLQGIAGKSLPEIAGIGCDEDEPRMLPTGLSEGKHPTTTAV